MHWMLKDHRRAKLWLLVVSVLVAGVIAVFVFPYKFRSTPLFNLATYDRIQVGMTLDEVSTIVGVPPGYYDVSPEEKFVNLNHAGKIAFGNQDYEEIETQTAVYDIVSRDTAKSVASLRKWANDENAIFVLTERDRVIGKMHCNSLTCFSRKNWLSDLRKRVGL